MSLGVEHITGGVEGEGGKPVAWGRKVLLLCYTKCGLFELSVWWFGGGILAGRSSDQFA